MKFVQGILLTVAAIGWCFAITGCGQSNAVQEDPAVAKTRLDAATNLRSYFDKAQGNWDALSPADKQAVIAITKSEAAAKEAFTKMIYVKPGAPAAGGLPPSGPDTVKSTG